MNEQIASCTIAVMRDTKITSRPLIIACVDDDALVREAIEGLLRAFDYGVLTFASAEAFLESGKLAAVDCIITDIRLGGKSGLQLQKELISTGHSIPTIVITAVAGNGYRAQAMRAGAIEVLSKPISSERLLEVVETALRGRGP
ncbi:response regulator [Mesorhizobium sp. WSM4307]|uniref:response regulator transcription factor n=1 Tax=unclassified Mesorhizobium TaxID=325217 RepID=UPI00115CE245|nr:MULTISPECIES: response regulator [unclassified Mesorhizobium]TRC75534.1 response regulator [Mesorhizobium sp. WSM4315]TRC86457.1 response regulator [Mesorhizobium sp. WSM4307]